MINGLILPIGGVALEGSVRGLHIRLVLKANSCIFLLNNPISSNGTNVVFGLLRCRKDIEGINRN